MNNLKNLSLILALSANLSFASCSNKETFPDCICQETPEWCQVAKCQSKAAEMGRDLFMEKDMYGNCICTCDDAPGKGALGGYGPNNCEDFRERMKHKERYISDEFLSCKNSGQAFMYRGNCFTSGGGGGGGGGICGGESGFVCCGGLCCNVAAGGYCGSDGICHDQAGGGLICGYDCDTLEMRCR